MQFQEKNFTIMASWGFHARCEVKTIEILASS
jgi:hypothetical protein